MSLIFVASFDTGDTPASFAKWNAAPTSPTVNTTNPRFTGANSIVTANPNLGGADTCRKLLGTGEDDLIIVGIAIRLEGSFITNENGGKGILRFGSDNMATLHNSVTISAAGAIRVFRGDNATLLAASANGLIVTDVWNYIEVKIRLHDSTGTVDIQLNGTNVCSVTGLDTKNAGTKTVYDYIELGGGGASSTCRIRDLYVANEQGSVNNNFLGDCRVTALFPDTDSTPEDWTLSAGANSASLIDETTPNGDTDYIESDVDGEVTRVSLGALADTTHTIFGLQTVLYAKKDDAGAKSVRAGFFSDASTQNLPDHVLGTSYATLLDISELDPDGSIPWTPTQLNAAFVQVEVRP